MGKFYTYCIHDLDLDLRPSLNPSLNPSRKPAIKNNIITKIVNQKEGVWIISNIGKFIFYVLVAIAAAYFVVKFKIPH